MGIATVITGGFSALFQRKQNDLAVETQSDDESGAEHWAQIYSDVPIVKTKLEKLLLDESFDADAPTRRRVDAARRLRQLTRH